jgi:hypothetical protein
MRRARPKSTKPIPAHSSTPVAGSPVNWTKIAPLHLPCVPLISPLTSYRPVTPSQDGMLASSFRTPDALVERERFAEPPERTGKPSTRTHHRSFVKATGVEPLHAILPVRATRRA